MNVLDYTGILQFYHLKNGKTLDNLRDQFLGFMLKVYRISLNKDYSDDNENIMSMVPLEIPIKTDGGEFEEDYNEIMYLFGDLEDDKLAGLVVALFPDIFVENLSVVRFKIDSDMINFIRDIDYFAELRRMRDAV